MSAVYENQQPVVLVVEDEIWIMLDVVELLEEHGYAVLCARNGDEALDLLAEHDDIQIVFTDVRMPGSIDGLELAREVRRRRPDIGVLITSGHFRGTESDVPERDGFIPKPYEPKIVISRIDGLVAGKLCPG